MSLPDQIFKPERYTYKDYLLWQEGWELVNGYPYAMSPSPNRSHQRFGKLFIKKAEELIGEACSNCNCETLYELDWVINDNTVVRPDCVIVCDNNKEDFITTAPVLIVEISSHATKLRDKNTKYFLYEMQGVKYYVIADIQKKTTEIFELINSSYVKKTDTVFELTNTCTINFDVNTLWKLM